MRLSGEFDHSPRHFRFPVSTLHTLRPNKRQKHLRFASECAHITRDREQSFETEPARQTSREAAGLANKRMVQELAKSNLDGIVAQEDPDEPYHDEEGTKLIDGKLVTAKERSQLTHYFKLLPRPSSSSDAESPAEASPQVADQPKSGTEASPQVQHEAGLVADPLLAAHASPDISETDENSSVEGVGSSSDEFSDGDFTDSDDSDTSECDYGNPRTRGAFRRGSAFRNRYFLALGQ